MESSIQNIVPFVLPCWGMLVFFIPSQLILGAGKTSLLQIYLQKSESPSLLATNGFFLLLIAFISSVDYYEKLLVKDGICYRIIFCDFSGQARLRPVLSAYLEAVNGVVFVVDGSNPQGLENILIFTELCLISLWFPSQRP